MPVKISIQTKTSTMVTFGLCGSSCRITGINATKAIISPDRLPIRSAKPVDWKQIPSMMITSSQRGKKIVVRVTEGALQRGISKWAQLKGFIREWSTRYIYYLQTVASQRYFEAIFIFFQYYWRIFLATEMFVYSAFSKFSAKS